MHTHVILDSIFDMGIAKIQTFLTAGSYIDVLYIPANCQSLAFKIASEIPSLFFSKDVIALGLAASVIIFSPHLGRVPSGEGKNLEADLCTLGSGVFTAHFLNSLSEV